MGKLRNSSLLLVLLFLLNSIMCILSHTPTLEARTWSRSTLLSMRNNAVSSELGRIAARQIDRIIRARGSRAGRRVQRPARSIETVIDRFNRPSGSVYRGVSPSNLIVLSPGHAVDQWSNLLNGSNYCAGHQHQ